MSSQKGMFFTSFQLWCLYGISSIPPRWLRRSVPSHVPAIALHVRLLLQCSMTHGRRQKTRSSCGSSWNFESRASMAGDYSGPSCYCQAQASSALARVGNHEPPAVFIPSPLGYEVRLNKELHWRVCGCPHMGRTVKHVPSFRDPGFDREILWPLSSSDHMAEATVHS